MLKKINHFYQKLHMLYIIDALFIIATIVGVFALRYTYPYGTDLMPQYFFNGERILTTNDGYHYANTTRDLLQGYEGEEAFYESAEFGLPAKFSAFIYRAISLFEEFSLDSFFYYLPIALCTLLVIPVFLIAKNLSNNSFVALFAAALAPITQAYSVRTMAGYYDTDMLILTLPLFGVYFLMRVLEHNKTRDVILCALSCILAFEWHRASAIYLLGFCTLLGVIYAFIFWRKNPKIYESLAIIIIALSQIPILVKLALIAVILHFMCDKIYAFRAITEKIKAHFKYQSIVIFLIALAVGLVANVEMGFSRFIFYVTGDSLAGTIAQVRGTADTIQELQTISFQKGVARIIGDYYLFTLGAIGTILLFIKKPQSLMLLPFLLLGLSSFWLGIRFSMFAAPVLSIGIFYLVHFILQYAKLIFDDKVVIYGVKVVVFAVMAYTSIMPHIYFGQNIGYKPSLFNEELSALNAIKEDSKSRDNVTIAWWDYGFLTSYYTHTRSIISGLDIDGIMHFFMARILTNTNQKASYNLIKMATSLYYDNNFSGNLMQKFITKYNISDNPNHFFDNLANMSDIKDADKSLKNRDIYLYIPYELFILTPTIAQFSDIDLQNGKATYTQSKLILYNDIKYDEKHEGFILDDIMHFDPASGILTEIESKKSIQLQAYYTIEREHNRLRTRTIQKYSDDKSKLIIVLSKELGKFLLLDWRTNNSLIVQFFLYENYDRNLFKLIYKGGESKAWKVIQ